MFRASERRARIVRLTRRLLRDDSGQDVIEYALLTALIAAGSVLLFSQIADAMEDAYNNWNSASQEVWDPCTLDDTCS